MRGRHRREQGAVSLKLVGAVLIAMVAMFAGLTEATANGEPKATPADYNTGGRWPASMTELCIEDKTHGFPVDEAVAEFDGLVDMTVKTDCTGEPFIVHVVTINEPDADFVGWFDARYVDFVGDARVYEAGRVRLNLAEAYRLDADDWRVVLIHELGHAVGLEHADADYSVMDPSTDMYRNRHLTETDKQQIRAIYGDER